MKRLPLFVVVGLLAIAIAVPMSGGMLGFGDASPAPTGRSAQPTTVVGASPSSPGSSATFPAATPAPTPEPATPVPMADVAIVPVTHFRAVVGGTNRAEVAKVLAGTSTRYEALALVQSEVDAILAALGVSRPADANRLVTFPDAAALTRDLAKHRKRLAFVRADAVTAAVRALAWGDRSLFGVDRITDAAEWRLHAPLPRTVAGADAPDAGFDPGATWTL